MSDRVLATMQRILGISWRPTAWEQVYGVLSALSDEDLAAAIERAAADQTGLAWRLTEHRTEAVVCEHDSITPEQERLIHAVARAARGEAAIYPTRWVVSCSADDARHVGAALQALTVDNTEFAEKFITNKKGTTNAQHHDHDRG